MQFRPTTLFNANFEHASSSLKEEDMAKLKIERDRFSFRIGMRAMLRKLRGKDPDLGL